MWSKILTVTGLSLALALPVAAQSTQSPSTSGSSSGSGQQGATSSQSNMAVQQKIKQDLTQAGFTNVQIMPESFLVRAHDKQNRPVLMVINPDSVTAVTQLSSPSGSASGHSGSGSSGTGTTNK